MFRKQTAPLIEVVSIIEGLETVKEALPRKSNKFIPEWWKETPLVYGEKSINKQDAGNVKACPSFPDYFSNGLVVPMWVDSIISYDEENATWRWVTAHNSFSWSSHGNEQFLDYVPFEHMGSKVKFVFKALCPWKLITPPGYSILQLPMFYHYTQEFTVFPGVVDTDRSHFINAQVGFTSDKKEIFIERGTPLFQVIPFKREKYNIEVRSQTEEDKKKFRNQDLSFFGAFQGTGEYLKMRREEDQARNKPKKTRW